MYVYSQNALRHAQYVIVPVRLKFDFCSLYFLLKEMYLYEAYMFHDVARPVAARPVAARPVAPAFPYERVFFVLVEIPWNYMTGVSRVRAKPSLRHTKGAGWGWGYVRTHVPDSGGGWGWGGVQVSTNLDTLTSMVATK